jgi:signal transduction histidine kinase/CheY-like chemotaxis protein
VTAQRRLRVLHLEDVAEDAELVHATLEDAGFDCTVTRVARRDDFVAALSSRGYDVLIADYKLPSFDGLTALDLARRLRPELPFLFVTGALQDDCAVETLRRGATDFIVKARLSRLVPAVQRALREVEEREELSRAEAALRLLADVSRALHATLDMELSLQNMARVLVPRVADACIVDGRAGDAPVERRSIVVHGDAHRARALQDLRARRSPAPDDAAGAGRVMRDGSAELVERFDDAHVAALARDAREAEVLRAMKIASSLVVPMIARGRTVGTVTLWTTSGRRPLDKKDVPFAHGIAERAAIAIENAQLHAATEKGAKARDEILAIVTHDLRNPLNAIVAGIDLVRDAARKQNDEQIARWAESVLGSTRTMTRLIADLLDFAAIESGGLVVVKERHDLVDVVREAAERFRGPAAAKGLALVAEIEGEHLLVHCDRERILQVLSNLLGNAVKFTPAGGRVSVRAGRRGGGGFDVVVMDSGPGIAASEVPHLFDRYWRAQRGGRAGVGLGLWIARRLVQAHDGELCVESRVGEGSSFTVVLPEHAQAAAPTPLRQRPRDEQAPCVLVVDDDVDVRLAIADVLEESGYRVVQASNGRDALELLESGSTAVPSLIVLDMMMPEMDGPTFRYAKQANPTIARIPVVVVSAYSDVLSTPSTPDVRAVLRKPLKPDTLCGTIASCLEAERSARPMQIDA